MAYNNQPLNPVDESLPPKERTQREKDIEKLIIAKTHIGAANLDYNMSRYVFKRNVEGHHLIDVSKTWEKLMIAARIIVAVENPADVVAVSARDYGRRGVLKFAHYTGAQAVAGRWTPGTFTNQITKKYMEPRLLIVQDPVTDAQAVKECFYANIPVIAVCNTNDPLEGVDIVIPGNTKGPHSIGIIYWLLAREVLRLRGEIPRQEEWDVLPDLFLYRDPLEFDPRLKAEMNPEEAAAVEAWGGNIVAETPGGGVVGAGGDWDNSGAGAVGVGAGEEWAASAVAVGGEGKEW